MTWAPISESIPSVLHMRVNDGSVSRKLKDLAGTSSLPRARSLSRLVWAAPLLLAAFLPSGCGGESKVPGIDLGAPEVSWKEKNTEQRFGFMAARVHPGMREVFVEYDEYYAEEFTCETCHGEEPELVNYAMPSDDLASLPKDNPIGATMEDSPEVGNFMMGKVLPAMQTMFSEGHGGATKVSCFACHPSE